MSAARVKLLLVRMLPVLLVTSGAMIFIAWVEGESHYVLRNAAPIGVVAVLCFVTLVKGNGAWLGAGWRWPLGTTGFAIPALGLTLYLHYAYAADVDGMVSDAPYPGQLFRYLPLYTVVAGGIGFAIGWIVGRNV